LINETEIPILEKTSLTLHTPMYSNMSQQLEKLSQANLFYLKVKHLDIIFDGARENQRIVVDYEFNA